MDDLVEFNYKQVPPGGTCRIAIGGPDFRIEFAGTKEFVLAALKESIENGGVLREAMADAFLAKTSAGVTALELFQMLAEAIRRSQ